MNKNPEFTSKEAYRAYRRKKKADAEAARHEHKSRKKHKSKKSKKKKKGKKKK